MIHGLGYNDLVFRPKLVQCSKVVGAAWEYKEVGSDHLVPSEMIRLDTQHAMYLVNSDHFLRKFIYLDVGSGPSKVDDDVVIETLMSILSDASEVGTRWLN